MPGGSLEELPLGHNSGPHKSTSSVEGVEEGYQELGVWSLTLWTVQVLRASPLPDIKERFFILPKI